MAVGRSDQREGAPRILDLLVEKVGPESLIGLRLFAAITLEGRKLYEVCEYDPETRRFRVREAETKRECSSLGNPLADFEIGVASRDPDDPLLQLLEAAQLPAMQFVARARNQAADVGEEAERDRNPSALQKGLSRDEPERAAGLRRENDQRRTGLQPAREEPIRETNGRWEKELGRMGEEQSGRRTALSERGRPESERVRKHAAAPLAKPNPVALEATPTTVPVVITQQFDQRAQRKEQKEAPRKPSTTPARRRLRGRLF